MKIGLQTWGSHGDIRPFVALANGLHAAGHSVTLAITCVDSDRYASLQEQLPYPLRHVASPVVSDRATLAHWGARIMAERNTLRQTQMVLDQFLMPVEAALVRASAQLCAENEVVIGHYILHTLGIEAERVGRPWISVALAHAGVPSAFRPPMGVPNWGPVCNRLAWRLARWTLNRAFKPVPDRLRASLGLAPAGDVLSTVWASPALNLLAASPLLCQAQPDWPASTRVVGAFDTPDSVAEGHVPPDVHAFLAAGDPPVYLTLGSMMSGNDEAQVVALLAEAARAASVRALVQAPSGAPANFALDPQVHMVRAAPHALVFPHCSAVLHHGGAGTSHAALRAGVPSVVVPHAAEQALWASELQRLGVAGQAIPRRRLSVPAVAAALREVTQPGARSAALRQRARALAAQLRQEDGVAAAVRLIEAQFQPAGVRAAG